jgi:hypothetical protein
VATRTLEKKETYVNEDIGNIVQMEHVNVQIADQGIATLFYLVGMGFTRDPHMMVGVDNMWVNMGDSNQFHIPTRPDHPQVLRGHIGIVTPSIAALEARLEAVAPRLAGTKFAYKRNGDMLDVTCPWGNLLRCYEPDPAFGPMSSGIPYVEFTVPTGTAEGIAAFYDKGFDAIAHVEKSRSGAAKAVVNVGQYQHLIFRETDAEIPPYDGHHIAIYVANFSKPITWLNQRGLVTEFPHDNNQFRFVDIIHPKTGEVLFQIEHEVRGMRHRLFNRPLVLRTPGQFQDPMRVGGRTVGGTGM